MMDYTSIAADDLSQLVEHHPYPEAAIMIAEVQPTEPADG